jgi:hypothetical protein
MGFPELRLLGERPLALRFFLVHPNQSSTARAPTTIPGKSPAKNGPAGKGLHFASASALSELLVESTAGLVDVGLLLLVADEVADVDEAEEAVVLALSPGKLPTKWALSLTMLHEKSPPLFCEHE